MHFNLRGNCPSTSAVISWLLNSAGVSGCVPFQVRPCLNTSDYSSKRIDHWRSWSPSNFWPKLNSTSKNKKASVGSVPTMSHVPSYPPVGGRAEVESGHGAETTRQGDGLLPGQFFLVGISWRFEGVSVHYGMHS